MAAWCYLLHGVILGNLTIDPAYSHRTSILAPLRTSRRNICRKVENLCSKDMTNWFEYQECLTEVGHKVKMSVNV
jgi:hypothetical protein